MSNPFFDAPILNSPYARPSRHWELDDTGQPTQKIVESRRLAQFVSPIPKPKKQKQKQKSLSLDEGEGLSTAAQEYKYSDEINRLRRLVELWREIPDPAKWNVTPETTRLLQHWRHHDFSGVRPFFCQLEAVEVAIWLTEVAPHSKDGKALLDHLERANREANPELLRLALKLATGAGKTTVMAMIIAWQTVNAVRRPNSKNFSRAFLIVTPGLTIKDRLRVLLPNDPDSYYRNRELVPPDMLPDLERAKIEITNYHAFKLREEWELASGTRSLLQGRGEALNTKESEGKMIQRVMGDLMGFKNICVLNDEAHHCYREKPPSPEEDDAVDIDPALDAVSKKDARDEAERNNEAARLWISGLEAVQRKLGVRMVYDLSATPFFLRGSGYNEGTIFPWTMSDFSLMDAIECGIVKLPRVPVAENIPGNEMPLFRNLWEHIRTDMPKKGRGTGGIVDPASIPLRLKTALEALYGHYRKTFDDWREQGVSVPPCFIIVCQNTAISKLVFDYVAGYHQQGQEGQESRFVPGALELFRNFDGDYGEPVDHPRTLLIDSEQLEAGESIDPAFRAMYADEIERFRREKIERSGDPRAGDTITDQELLREVMNTVGKSGQLGAHIRCVVSVSMLTEGWDANTVTHVLGIRAFGTQLLCEQVIGRALRRQSYDLNEQGLFNVEYADVFGIPFDFTAKPAIAKTVPPRETIQVRAVRPERDSLEIRFPRVEGYRTELPEEEITAEFTADSVFTLTPEIVGPTRTKNAGIIGESADLNVDHLDDVRQSRVLMELTKHLLETRYREPGEPTPIHLFGKMKRVVREWLDTCLDCHGDTYPAFLIYKQLAEEACNRIQAAITRGSIAEHAIRALVSPYNPVGSTMHVRFNTSKLERWETRADRCHINWVILDSDWEAEFCRVVEDHPRVRAYVKNHSLGFEVPYTHLGKSRIYRPDFIVLVDDGHAPQPDGTPDLLHLVVEIKGFRGEDVKDKHEAMTTYWVPGVNNLKTFGRWAFAEFGAVYEIEADFKEVIEKRFAEIVEEKSVKIDV